MATLTAFIAGCADEATAPPRDTESVRALSAQVNCVVYVFSGWVGAELSPGENGTESWVEAWSYNGDTDETTITICVYTPEAGGGDGPGGDGGDGGGGGGTGDPGTSCLTAPWAPECDANPPGGGGGGGGSPGGNPGAPIAPQVQIECLAMDGSGSSVVRGEPVECRVVDTLPLQGWVVIREWQFDPEAGAIDLPRVTDNSNSKTFLGRVAIGGQVTLNVRLQKELTDDLQSPTASFTVTARSHDTFAIPTAEQIHAAGPYPVRSAQPSTNRAILGTMTDTLYRSAQPISVGPNAGYRYLKMPTDLNIRSFITIPYDDFRLTNGYYYLLAPPSFHAEFCSQPFVRDHVPFFVEQHEGVNRETGSHTSAAFDYVAANIAEIRNRLEALVYVENTSELLVNDAMINTAAYNAAKSLPDNVLNYNKFGPSACTVRYQ